MSHSEHEEPSGAYEMTIDELEEPRRVDEMQPTVGQQKIFAFLSIAVMAVPHTALLHVCFGLPIHHPCSQARSAATIRNHHKAGV